MNRPWHSVDNLEDVSALERYVKESAVMLLFLSRGCECCPARRLWVATPSDAHCLELSAPIHAFADLKSGACLREVVATLEQKKPYLFVHEADPAKGGASLPALQLELMDEAHRGQLFDGRPATVWHRIAVSDQSSCRAALLPPQKPARRAEIASAQHAPQTVWQ